jgi:hypothetical protein
MASRNVTSGRLSGVGLEAAISALRIKAQAEIIDALLEKFA